MRSLFLVSTLFCCFGLFAQQQFSEEEKQVLDELKSKIGFPFEETLPLFTKAKKEAKKEKNRLLYYEIMELEATFMQVNNKAEEHLILADSLINQSVSKKLKAFGYRHKGNYYSIKAEATEALSNYEKAMSLFMEEEHEQGIKSVKRSMGNMFFYLNNYPDAAHYYRKSLNNSPRDAPAYNNLIRVYSAMKMQDSAVYFNNKLNGIAFGEHGDPELQFMAHLNNAEFAPENEKEYILESLNSALEISKYVLKIEHREAIVYQVRSATNLRFKDFEQAEKDAKTAMEIFEKIDTKSDYLTTQRILFKIYREWGKYDKMVEELESYLENYSAAYNEFINEKTKEFQIKYETEEKKRQIAEQELEIQKKSVQMRNWLIVGIIIIGGFLIFVFQMRRNQKNHLKIMEKEKENEVLSARILGEEIERSRISKELHDGIASNLVAVKLQIENNAEISQKILSLVLETHKEVRQIAHNLMPIDFDKQNVVEVIKTFCEECSTENRPVNFQTNAEKINLNKDRSMVLYRSVQEFIQNAIKHSEAKQIDVLLMENDGIVTINIEDDGTGFDTKLKETSKGLSGAVERLEKIKGHINIDSSNRGTSVFISIKPD